jgi:hypothetical protein
MCPSPETRSPGMTPRTPGPTASTMPMYSWPTTRGTGTVFCAHSSHFQMCMSVPQIEAMRTLISTSP